MIGKPIEEITEQELQALVVNKVTEDRTLEYKLSLPGNTDAEKKEFLADVSSFANTAGGDLVYGIAENPETREPEAVQGVALAKVDEVKVHLDSIIRDGLSPRIMGHHIRHVPLANGNVVLVIRVPQSWNSPHRVVYGGHDKFYARESNGKYTLDVTQLRAAFGVSESISAKMRSFVGERLLQIHGHYTPVSLAGTSELVLHIIPFSAFTPGRMFDVYELRTLAKLCPIGATGFSARINLDGMLHFVANQNEPAYSYALLYRNGIVEAVDTWLLRPDHGKFIPSRAFTDKVVTATKDYFEILKEIDCGFHIVVHLSLIGVKDYKLALSGNRYSDAVDRELIQCPELLIDTYAVNAALLKPMFDSVWNACGLRQYRE